MPVLIPGLLPQHLLPSYSLSLTWCTENEKSKNTILSRRLLLVWLKNKGKQTNKHPLKSTTVPPVTVLFLFLHCAGLHKGKWKSKINTCDRWGNCCTDVCLSVCLSVSCLAQKFGADWNISTSIEQMARNCCADVHAPLQMYPNDFGES